MPGTSPLLSGLTLADPVQGVGTGEFPAHRSGRGSDRGTLAPPVRVPCCHPGLDPGSSLSGTVIARFSPERGPGRAWTPDQVRGDSGGAETVPPVGTGPVPTLNRTAVEQVRA